MRRSILSGLLIFAFVFTPVKADIGPPPPQPPVPDGPDKASIRGVGVQRIYTYWRGRRWMTVVDICAASQPACRGKDLAGCFVVGIDGHSIGGGETALLLAAASSSGEAPIKLTLEHCAVTEIELSR
jgi:hypothetical protein